MTGERSHNNPRPMLKLLKNAGHVFEKGGPVVWVLLAVSVLSVTLAFERAAFWLSRHKPGCRAWIRKAIDRLNAGDLAAVKTMAAGDTSLDAGVIDELRSARLADSTAVGLVGERRGAVERFNRALSTISRPRRSWACSAPSRASSAAST